MKPIIIIIGTNFIFNFVFFFFEIQNYETINYILYQATSICTLVLFDILNDIVHVCTKKEPQVSWQAHFFGGISGIFLG